MDAMGGLAFLAAGFLVMQAAGQAQEGNEETPRIQKLRGILQENIARLPLVTPDTDVGKMAFQTLDLSAATVTVDDGIYCAFRFKTPDYATQLAWGFRRFRGLREWYIVPAQGRMFGFASFMDKELPEDVEGLAPKGTRFILQRLDAKNLRPGAEYIMWFRIDQGVVPTITYFLDLVASKRVSYRNAFPLFYTTPPPNPLPSDIEATPAPEPPR